MSSGTISQTPIRSIAPRGGSKARQTRNQQDPEEKERERRAVEMIALELIKLRIPQQADAWTYDPKHFKSKGRRNTKEKLVLRKVKKQLCTMAQTRAVMIERRLRKQRMTLTKAEYDRLVPRAIDLIFSEGWMEIAGESKTVSKQDRSRRVKGGGYALIQHKERRLVCRVTGLGNAAYGRSKAIETNHPSTGVIPINELASAR